MKKLTKLKKSTENSKPNYILLLKSNLNSKIMKRFLLFGFTMISLLLHSQVYVGVPDYLAEKTKANSAKVMEQIKGRKILFVLPDKFSRADYEKLLSESWTFSEYEVVPIKDFNENPSKYLQVSSVVAEYSGFLKTINYTNPNRAIKEVDYVFIDIEFYVVNDIKIGKKETKYDKTIFGKISFCPDYTRMRDNGLHSYMDISPEYLRNYHLGFLKNYVKVMSNNLSANTLYDGYSEVINKSELNKLKKQKLYISQDVKQKNIGLNRDERNIEKLTEDYKFEKVFVSNAELNEKIQAGEVFYYLFYHQDNSKKIISVVNSQTGEVIYNALERMSFNVQEKDFKSLQKVIEKI